MTGDSRIVDKYLEAHTDQRGSLYEVYRRDTEGFEARQVYFSRSRPGAIRGNHYHKRKTECFSVILGKAVLRLVDVSTGNEFKTVLEGMNPRLVIAQPGVAHGISAVGPEDATLLIIVSEEYDAGDADVFDYHVL